RWHGDQRLFVAKQNNNNHTESSRQPIVAKGGSKYKRLKPEHESHSVSDAGSILFSTVSRPSPQVAATTVLLQ
ncbi:hypothetical protein BaRGS_00032944, partial [Batillaria attramentaria]